MSQSHVVQTPAEGTPEAKFKEACGQARDLLAAGAEEDLRSRYSVAVIAKEVREDVATYGERSVETLADELGQDKSTIYKWIKVAKAFEHETISDVLEKRDRFGRPLSWSHVALCASVPKREMELLERALREWPSVKDLKKLVAAARSGSKEPTVPSMHRAVTELAKHLSRAAVIAEALQTSPMLAAGNKDAENIKALCTAALVQSKALPVVLTALIEQFEPRPGLKRAQQARRPAANASNKPRRQAKGTKRRSAA